jgi:hypothetical protein
LRIAAPDRIGAAPQFPPLSGASFVLVDSRLIALAVAAALPWLAGCASSSRPETAAAPVSATPPAAAPAAALPLEHAPRPTTAAITAADLMTRLYVFADDSMQGREAGTPGHQRGTAYIAAQAQAIGLRPAGENGTYLQTVPMVTRQLAADSKLSVEGGADGGSDGQPLTLGTDWVPVPPLAASLPFGGQVAGSTQAIYGGRAGEVATYITPEQARGKVVVLGAPRGPNGQPTFQFWSTGELSRFKGAAVVAIATLSLTPPQLVEYFSTPQQLLKAETPAGAPFGIIVTPEAAARLMGAADLTALTAGATGATVKGSLRFENAPTAVPTSNVVAVLQGSDPALRGQYVVLGAHSDHVGISETAVDHDSLRAYNAVVRPEGAESEERPATPAEAVQIRAMLDSLRATHPRRPDTVFNGADDDGSGSMALLEIAEALAAAPQKPKRSVLFVWHTAEEKGLFGSEWFAFNPTVPRDSIVAALNIDMIGRGGPQDVKDGGPRYLQLIGSRRLSTQLGDLVEQVNTSTGSRFTFDYSYDADGHPANIYCRSDHYNYARFGIPVVFFTTGVHRDYHQLTDESQYIDYEHYASVTGFITDVLKSVADLPQRPVVDRPKPDPYGACQQ